MVLSNLGEYRHQDCVFWKHVPFTELQRRSIHNRLRGHLSMRHGILGLCCLGPHMISCTSVFLITFTAVLNGDINGLQALQRPNSSNCTISHCLSGGIRSATCSGRRDCLHGWIVVITFVSNKDVSDPLQPSPDCPRLKALLQKTSVQCNTTCVGSNPANVQNEGKVLEEGHRTSFCFLNSETVDGWCLLKWQQKWVVAEQK